jgi:hypothetical protein
MRSPLALLILLVVAGCGSTTTRCVGASCLVDGGSGDGGHPGACVGGCSGFLPVCDVTRGVCVTCTDGAGCFAPSAVCDVAAGNGRGACVTCTAQKGCAAPTPMCLMDSNGSRCVQCEADTDCSAPLVCDHATNHCAPVVDAGSPGDGGMGGEVDAGLDAGAFGGNGFTGPDGGPCIPPTAGAMCTVDCAPGFHCAGGICALNGNQGPVQVTLRWNTDEDVDLHLREPKAGGGFCEIYYGDRQGSNCGARGSLDLDSNAGCSIDHVDIENIIYDPDAGAPSGLYSVYVDHFANCDTATVYVPFQVEVRVHNSRWGYCGAFFSGGPGWSDGAGALGGQHVLDFVVP